MKELNIAAYENSLRFTGGLLRVWPDIIAKFDQLVDQWKETADSDLQGNVEVNHESLARHGSVVMLGHTFNFQIEPAYRSEAAYGLISFSRDRDKSMQQEVLLQVLVSVTGKLLTLEKEPIGNKEFQNFENNHWFFLNLPLNLFGPDAPQK